MTNKLDEVGRWATALQRALQGLAPPGGRCPTGISRESAVKLSRHASLAEGRGLWHVATIAVRTAYLIGSFAITPASLSALSEVIRCNSGKDKLCAADKIAIVVHRESEQAFVVNARLFNEAWQVECDETLEYASGLRTVRRHYFPVDGDDGAAYKGKAADSRVPLYLDFEKSMPDYLHRMLEVIAASLAQSSNNGDADADADDDAGTTGVGDNCSPGDERAGQVEHETNEEGDVVTGTAADDCTNVNESADPEKDGASENGGDDDDGKVDSASESITAEAPSPPIIILSHADLAPSAGVALAGWLLDYSVVYYVKDAERTGDLRPDNIGLSSSGKVPGVMAELLQDPGSLRPWTPPSEFSAVAAPRLAGTPLLVVTVYLPPCKSPSSKPEDVLYQFSVPVAALPAYQHRFPSLLATEAGMTVTTEVLFGSEALERDVLYRIRPRVQRAFGTRSVGWHVPVHFKHEKRDRVAI